MKKELGKRQSNALVPREKPRSNFLTGLDPAKISQWLELMGNPAVQNMISQFTSKPSSEVEQQPRRRRGLFF
ncbi:hypothetical protein [Brevibacillus sp. H7]|uniref:hypothetical protein n=1 Tax=Brevibacillus sp. H7 TaxID=3349138 RepID=UPI0037F76B7B